MKQPRTLWTNRESKFKPRNKQAALICIKAKEIHLPPPEPVEYTPRKEEVLKEIELKLAELQKVRTSEEQRQKKLKEEAREAARNLKEKRKKQPPRKAWLGKWLRKAERQKGSLSPSPEAIAAVKKAHTKPSTPKDHV